MQRIRAIGFCAVVISAVLAGGCEKPADEKAKNGTTTTDPSFRTIQPIAGFGDETGASAVDGIMACIYNREMLRTTQAEENFDTTQVQAFFYTTPGKGPFMNAGTVMIDTLILKKVADSSYSDFGYRSAFPKGYPFNSIVEWKVGGNIPAGINPINYSTANMDTFPTHPKIDTLLFSMVRSQPFTLRMVDTVGNIIASPNDEVFTVYSIKQGNTSIAHRLNATSRQYVFNTAELSVLTAGYAYLEIAVYRAHTIDAGLKKYLVLNGVRTRRKVLVK